MPFDAPFSVAVAPQADAQIKAASAWWRKHRLAAPDLLRDDVGSALLLISECPEIGRALRTKRFGTVRMLVLRRTAYLLYYQVIPQEHEVRVVHFRHGRRRPLR